MLRGSVRRSALCVGGAALVMLASAAGGWACASVGAVDIDPGVVQPGQQAVVKVTFVSKDKPVELRWDALNGPVLATIEPATFTEGLHGNWRFANGTITIPADAKSGSHIVVASQEFVRGTATWGMPARGLVQVGGPSAPVLGQQVGPAPAVRPATLVSEDSVSTGSLLLVGLGAAGLTMLIGGFAVILASARRSDPTAAPVSTGAKR